MADTTVEKLASEIGKTADRLVEQLSDAGIKKSKSDTVSESEKQQLLDFLKKQHGGDATPTKMTLQRKSVSTLSVGSGRDTKVVKVEVRKKRTFVKRDPAAEAAAKAEQDTQVAAETEAKAKSDADAKSAADALAQEKSKVAEEAKEKAKVAAAEKAKPVALSAEENAAKAESDKLQSAQEQAAKSKADEEANAAAEAATAP